MVVIYAEKHDMAEKIARALGGQSFNRQDAKGGHYRIRYKGTDHAVTWGAGHLCGLADASSYNPDYKNWRAMPLPFIPKEYKLALNLKSRNPVTKLYANVKELFGKADWIVNATDFDREGELIFYYVYTYMGCRKPVMRAKLASTTKDGILSSFDNLMKSSEFAGMLSSARCRGIADWVVGCNLTAAMTLSKGGLGIYPVGRVQTPTLAMVVARDEEIAGFKPEDYYEASACFTTDKGEQYEGLHSGGRFGTPAEAGAIAAKCDGKKGRVKDIALSEKERQVPDLYDLNMLQMDANSRYGFSADRTLDITQKLYEGGYVTYPRTDCRYLPEDMVPQITKIQGLLKAGRFKDLFGPDADGKNMLAHKRQFFDDKKLGAHYAIIPTDQIPGSLDPDAEKVYGMVVESVVRMLYPAARVATTKVVTDVGGELFETSGTSVTYKGWLHVGGSVKEELLPDLTKGQEVSCACSAQAKKTKPPKHFTDRTLLAAMMSAGKAIEDDELRKFMAGSKIEGIGTVATRAPIIKGLLDRGLLTRDKKSIVATQAGKGLIHAVPVEDVKSAVMTARYEKELSLIASGQEDPGQFLNRIYSDVTRWCAQIGKLPKEAPAAAQNTTSLMCPVCGSSLNRYKWGYGCSRHSDGCKFSIGAIAGKMLTEKQVEELLSKERLGPLPGFRKKDGGRFEASLKLEAVEEGGEIVNYKVSFDFPRSPGADAQELEAACPGCGSPIVKGRFGWACSKGCGISVPYVLCQHKVTEEEAKELFAGRPTPRIEGMVNKKGKAFSACLSLNAAEKKLEFKF